MGKCPCIHKSSKYQCKICTPSAFCIHDKRKDSCRICNPSLKKTTQNRKFCVHNKRQDSCKLCSGCEHGKMKYYCSECKGVGICEHNKQKSICKECKGGSICEHNHIRTTCKECKGGSICEHNIQKSSCKHCNKNLYCIHGYQKAYCKECNGTQICEHNKRRYYCFDCKGQGICEHKRQTYQCSICKGKGICEHNIRRYDCKFCDPQRYLVNLQRQKSRYILSKIGKTKSTAEYLGCSSQKFYEYILSKMTPEMTLENIHIDHIKPVSKFDLSDPEEVYKCCHWSNLQPLLALDNSRKNNKWTNENENDWNKNIIKYVSQRMSVGE